MDRATDFPNDPRSLTLEQRRAFCRRLGDQQRRWLSRLRRLAETALADDFPAYLLATPPFAGLAAALDAAGSRARLATGPADELDRFVDAYRDYLRTDAGEDVFGPGPQRRAG